MKKLKRLARSAIFICLIVLATLGVGIAGAVIIPVNTKRQDDQSVKVELVEKSNESEENDQK